MCMCALEALLIVLTYKWCASNIDCVSGDACDLFPTYQVHVQCYVDSGHVQYIERHLHRFTEQTILHHYVGRSSVLTSVNSSTEEL